VPPAYYKPAPPPKTYWNKGIEVNSGGEYANDSYSDVAYGWVDPNYTPVEVVQSNKGYVKGKGQGAK